MPPGFALPTDFTEDAAEPTQIYVPARARRRRPHAVRQPRRLRRGAARQGREPGARERGAARGHAPAHRGRQVRHARQPRRVRRVAAGRDPGPAPPRGRGDRGGGDPAAADRLRQRREPAARARRLSPARARAARRGRRRPRPADRPAARRGPGAGARRQRSWACRSPPRRCACSGPRSRPTCRAPAPPRSTRAPWRSRSAWPRPRRSSSRSCRRSRRSKLDLTGALREGGPRSAGGASHRRWRRGVVVAQAAFAALLAVGAGLMGRSLGALTRIDLGFEPKGVLTQRLSLPAERLPGRRST